MKNKYVDIAEGLRLEAKQLLENDKLWNVFTDHGVFHAVGSYALNLLVWRDLDLYFESKEAGDSIAVFADAAKTFILNHSVIRVKLEKELYKTNPYVPKGTYMGIKIKTGENRLWKIDLWEVDTEYQNSVLHETASLKEKMTPEKRELILRRKHELMASKERTPSFSSYYLYQAVLKENITEPDAIKDYLKAHRINL